MTSGVPPPGTRGRLTRPSPSRLAARKDAAFNGTHLSAQAWDILLDTHGEAGAGTATATREAFRLTYPFSPAFTHAMVDISGALQRERTALKLMQQLLVDYRDPLPVGQLMPLGAIFDVLASGADRPFTDKLRDEFEQVKRFYTQRVRPYLLMKHGLSEDQAKTLSPKHPFRADDLVVKTLLLAALVPNVLALNGLTATRWPLRCRARSRPRRWRPGSLTWTTRPKCSPSPSTSAGSRTIRGRWSFRSLAKDPRPCTPPRVTLPG